ncbi:WhiB family transcriptional regulator, redox-sensing transcriptional regulator [Streptomyces sp. 3213]|uniref:WhiB family transcriptional regulator n=1 Tax=Streptomyces sp. 3213.3 TaxID=1855348 RepID=UPI00089AB49A|nr:WhiB family transcriptional regulator [Streptomyces sp. 3213.3]SEE92666.1 WhiB family transcriptional regulator, redox-sensing transcriptional regulator [Streptomyces sp. 3213] [Streptomyces sp. 3213.3]
MHWRERAACLHVDPELFFPLSDSGLPLRQIEEAKAVCDRCPVSERCLEWAMRVGQADGIWGGTTERERRAMRADSTSRAHNAARAIHEGRPQYGQG